MADEGILQRLMGSQPQAQYEPRLGVDIAGRGVTNPLIAFLQLIEGHGLNAAQLDRNAAMRGPLYSSAIREHPELRGQNPNRGPYNETDRRMLSEDMNNLQIKYNNWRKQNLGQELSPQDRVTQGFVDVRNPNSRW